MKHYKLVLTAFFLLLTSVSFAATQAVKITFSKPSTVIKVQKSHPEFTLTLPSNRTTGFQWVLLKHDNKLVSLKKHQYIAPNTKLMGAPGFETFMFKVKPAAFAAAKTTTVVMQYSRPWEKNKGPISVFKIKIIK